MPALFAARTVAELPITRRQAWSTASQTAALRFAGMIEEDSPSSGRIIDGRPPMLDVSNRMSLQTFVRTVAGTFSPPQSPAKPSWAAISRDGVRLAESGRAANGSNASATRTAKSGCAFIPLPLAVPPCGRQASAAACRSIAALASSSCRAQVRNTSRA